MILTVNAVDEHTGSVVDRVVRAPGPTAQFLSEASGVLKAAFRRTEGQPSYDLLVDVLYFLKERTRFIRKFYDVAENTFAETKRKIGDGEPPFDEWPPSFNPEYGEPAFMEEYQDADDAQEFLGQSGVSFLSASLKLFLDEMRADLCRFKNRVPQFDTKYAKKSGFLAANQQWFGAIGIDFARSGADLAIIEEVVLARNLAQHPESIGSMNLTLRGSEVKRPPFPWFVHEFERHNVDPENLDNLERFSWMLSITREKFLRAINEVDTLCEYIDRRARGQEPDGAESAS